VRNNRGGSSSIGYKIISYLIDKPLFGSHWKTRQYLPAFRAWGREEQWYEGNHDTIEPRAENHYSGPVVVLTGPGTVSAAEDFVVALHASGRAILVGQKTAGTTGQPLMIKLPRGGKARICTKRDMYPDGREFVGIGIIPDVKVCPTQESTAAGRDTVLVKAITLLAKESGVGPISATVLSAKVSSQHQKSPLRDRQNSIAKIMKAIKVEYDSLAVAYAKKDWNAVDTYADNVSDLFRDEFLGAFDIEIQLEQLRAEGRLNQQTKYDLMIRERREKDIKIFFGDKTDMEKLHNLIVEIEDLSDEIHDCARDGQFDGISICFTELEKRWKLLLSYMQNP